MAKREARKEREAKAGRGREAAVEGHPRHAHFLVVWPDAEGVRLLGGFSAFAAWVNLLICFEGLLRDTVVYGGGVVRDPLFVAAMAVAGVALLLARRPWLSRRGGAKEGEGRAGWPRVHRGLCVFALLGAASGIAGVVLSALASSNGFGIWLAATLIGCVAGAFIAVYTLAWGAVIASFDMREILVVLCAALCAQWVLFVIVVFSGAFGKVFLAAALPLLSWWCLRGLSERLGRPAHLDGDGGQVSGVAGEESRDDRATARVAGSLFCFAFVVQFVWTCNIVMTGAPLPEGQFWLVYVCVLAVTSLSMAVILGLMERWHAYRMELFYRMAFALGVVGSVALPLSYHHLLFSYAVIYVAYALIDATMWILAWSVAFMRKISPRRVIGGVFGLQFLAMPCGFAAAKLMQWLSAGQGEALLPYVGFAAVTVLVVAYVFVLPERTLLLLSPRLLKLDHESLDARCRDIALSHGLTTRESEIFALLARGRDVGYIEKELFISRNTVNTHRKNLYRKLGIHTQQELLSLIEDELS